MLSEQFQTDIESEIVPAPDELVMNPSLMQCNLTATWMSNESVSKKTSLIENYVYLI